MKTINSLLEGIPIPPVVKIRQKFNSEALQDPIAILLEELQRPGGIGRIKEGQKIAILVGSRGIANLAPVTKAVIQAVRERGAYPFIVPTMGSHGGATAQGQKSVLKHLGIDEITMGVPIASSMDVMKIGELKNGLPIYVGKEAATADGIIAINRIKPHTAFRGAIESGIMKMLTIGMGKQKGAEACHQLGFKYMAENVLGMGRRIIEKLPILFGVALLENAYDQTSKIEVLPRELIEEREKELLVKSKGMMPRIMFEQIDVLVVDYLGKNISGDGMDPNITGRYPTPYAYGGPEINKIVVLDLTRETEGNANGIGTADFTTRRLINKINLEKTYINGLTSTVCGPTKIPTILENDRYAIKAAIKTCNILDFNKCRLVRIKDTLHLDEIEISLSMLEEAKGKGDIEILSEPYPLTFDNGNLR